MERIDRIVQNSAYKSYREKISGWEKERIYCHHDVRHFLDVARLAWILNIEEGLSVEKEFIYAAALLHDIGRFKQYEDGSDHASVSAGLAAGILKECGFLPDEITVITEAVRKHRTKEAAGGGNLNGLLYRADKLSRACFFCEAEDSCDWKAEKKNLFLTY